MTMNGKWRSLIIQVSAIAILLLPVLANCGNLPMVEKSVDDLETLNNKAIKQIPGIPRDGTVDLKAHVTMDKETPIIRIEEQKIQTMGAQKLKSSTVQGVDISAPVVDGTIEFKE